MSAQTIKGQGPDGTYIPVLVDDDGKLIVSGGGGGGAVDSVNGQTGVVVLDAEDVLPTQTGNNGKFLTTDGSVSSWATLAGGGDMAAATYDPQAIAADAFDQDNMTDGTTNKNYTATEQSKLAGVEALADVTDATNVAAAGAIMDGDFSTNGLMKRTGAGTYATATAGTDYLAPAAIGTTVQAFDSDLSTLAGLTATTDNFIVSVSSAWASRTPSQVKTTLSLNNVDNTSDASKNTAAAYLQNKDMSDASNTLFNKTSITSSSTPSPTGDSPFNNLYITALAAGATFAAPSGTVVNGNRLRIRVKDNGTARSLAFNAVYISSGVATLPTTTVVNKTHFMEFEYDSAAAKWVLLAVDATGY